jgi:hypothetical protein
MECDPFREQLPELLTGDLEPREREAALRHVRGCASCAAELDAHRRTWEALGVLEPAEPVAAARLDALATAALARAREPERPEGGEVATATVRVLPASRWRSLATRVAAAAVLVVGTAFATRWWLERGGALPDYLDEPDFVTHFELLRELPALDRQGELLDVGDELTALSALEEA